MNVHDLNYELVDGLATITINRPERLNALGHGTALEMLHLLEKACSDQARALILTGTGRFFSSGGDLTTNLDLSDIGEPLERLWNPLSEKLMSLPMPVITAMNGPSVGIGCAIALVADLVIADRSSYFFFSFADLGIIPDGGVAWLLTKSIGRQRASRLIMLAEKLSAPVAEEWGLVYKVVDDGQALEEARTLGARLAKGPTLGYSLIRRSIQVSLEQGFTDNLKFEREVQVETGRSADFKEALTAFREKRAPHFQGR